MVLTESWVMPGQRAGLRRRRGDDAARPRTTKMFSPVHSDTWPSGASRSASS